MKKLNASPIVGSGYNLLKTKITSLLLWYVAVPVEPLYVSHFPINDAAKQY